ncbi:hypothetical protein R3W88_024669 [Solanum pinnatisectum]|uniref:Uncharacterized protein n=1 Tax=Solanum pinnatisectum TaxID=50273 RepID=A0AAV9M133_9SOLN|nr:hypothetical protein R3W88_024669 [Solanum pinnatisectum]
MTPPPPPSSYDNHIIRDNDDDRGVHTNQQLPPPSLYSASSIRGRNDGKDVHTNQQLLTPPPSYLPLSIRENDANMGVQVNNFQQTLQPTRRTYVRGLNSIVIDLNETPLVFEGPHINEIDFSILDRFDPSLLKFKPLTHL